ncbi:AAA family ATPase, partial [Candidatus Bathyarchaeota archaeon]|nr:AAA family ATPase [Candidatus Bathyarchaeota archaeon]
MLIQEVILENFMSYEYARVPFESGVNLVCGPNGSGKSSLLLAISVALGQSYTERSKKLSDLIRWGRDQARVTLILNNTKRGKRRPIPKIRKDQIFLTRVMRKDGKYWFELENRAATKAEVERLLARLGVDPDNMLIIMHQNMVEQFTVLSPQEKLRMVESAVGLESYRTNVLKAQKKLTRVSSQESSISKLLQSAEQTLNYWREQYDRYQEKKQLLTKRRFLERESDWAEVARRENMVRKLESNTKKEQDVLNQVINETNETTGNIQIQQNQLEKLKDEWKSLFDSRLSLEREKAKGDSIISLCGQLLRETIILENAIQSRNPSPQLRGNIEETVLHRFKLLRSENLKDLIQNSNQQLSELNPEIDENKKTMESLEEDVEKVNSHVLDNRIRLALLQYREENISAELERLKRELRDAKACLDEALSKAEYTGSRIAVVKSIGEILDEIRVTDGHLAAL